MAENLSAFLKQNAIAAENEKYVVSKRFVDKGEPVEWEICVINAVEDEELRKSYTKRIQVNGKRNLYRSELDANAYLAGLAVKCTVYPNLHDSALQDSYGVKGAEKLLKAMLEPGEYYDYITKVQELNGFDVSMEEKVEEAKN